MRLFQITDTETGKPVPNLFFSKKADAKRERFNLNDCHGNGPEELTELRYVVSPGPDHKNYKG